MLLFVIFAAILVLALIAAVRQLRSEGLPRGPVLTNLDKNTGELYFQVSDNPNMVTNTASHGRKADCGSSDHPVSDCGGPLDVDGHR
jgi:hypothetical protein